MPFLSPLWVAAPAHRGPPPRPRRDVADGAADEPRWPGRRPARAPAGAPALPPHAGSSPCRSRRARELVHELGFRPDRVARRPARHRPPLRTRRHPSPTTRSSSRWAGSCRSSGTTVLLRAVARGSATRPRPRARDRGRRATRAASLERSDRRARRRVVGQPRRAGRPTTELLDLYRRAWVRRQRVGPRGLGHDPHRGRRVRHAGGRHPDRGPRRRRRRRRSRACSSTRRRPGARRRDRRVSMRRPLRRERLAAARSSTPAALTWDAARPPTSADPRRRTQRPRRR